MCQEELESLEVSQLRGDQGGGLTRLSQQLSLIHRWVYRAAVTCEMYVCLLLDEQLQRTHSIVLCRHEHGRLVLPSAVPQNTCGDAYRIVELA